MIFVRLAQPITRNDRYLTGTWTDVPMQILYRGIFANHISFPFQYSRVSACFKSCSRVIVLKMRTVQKQNI